MGELAFTKPRPLEETDVLDGFSCGLIPVILLGMLGVDERFQERGLRRNLVLDASKRALSVSEAIGARALVVNPAGEGAARLYRSCGFREIPGSDRMYARLQ